MGQYFDNEKLPSKMVKTSAVILGKKFTFFTDNGVFSKDGLDFGSRLLLETIPLEEVGGKILDMGCGYGVFGIVIGKLAKAHVDMVDVNLRALHLAERNIKENHVVDINVFESNVYENVSGKYSTIVTNPPIRVGKDKLLEILTGAFDHLNDDGVLYFVIRKDQGALSIKKILENDRIVETINKDKGYFIYKVKKMTK